MKESKFYTCEYCYDEYIPKRRGVQRFCSNSCRSKNHHKKNKSSSKIQSLPPISNSMKEQSAKEKMSLAGTGNATAGSLLADGIKSVLTPELKKAATKQDLINLKIELLGRYHPINNLSMDSNQRKPYYDLHENIIVYI